MKFLSKYCPVIALSTIATAATFCVVQAAPTMPKEGEFDQISTVASPRLTYKSTERVTFKGTKYRLESTDPSSYIPYEDIEDGQSYYHFIPTEHAALRLDLKDKQVSPLEELHSQTLQMLQGLTKTGEVTVNGFQCNVFSRSVNATTKITFYQSTDPRFPYIVKTLMVDSSESMTRSNSIDNVKLDVPVSDDIFTLPKDTKIVQQPAGSDQTGTTPAPDSPAPVSK